MKINILIILSVLISLSACNKKELDPQNTNPQATSETKADTKANQKTDPIPATIDKKEVARIALLEAKQFLSNANNKQLKTSAASQAYAQAEKLFNAGEFKKAQIKAVQVRQMLEDILLKAKTSK